jgi:hypothetical protein
LYCIGRASTWTPFKYLASSEAIKELLEVNAFHDLISVPLQLLSSKYFSFNADVWHGLRIMVGIPFIDP